MTTPEWLALAARRSRSEPGMLGHVFERYRQLESRSEEELATELGCTQDVIRWMSLCRRPEDPHFAEQASAIAARFDIELKPLVHLLRRVDVMGDGPRRPRDELEGTRPVTRVAARDRVEDEETGS